MVGVGGIERIKEIKARKVAQNIQNPTQDKSRINLLHSTGHEMHQQFNIQQMYALPTLYVCVLYLSENKQRLAPLTA